MSEAGESDLLSSLRLCKGSRKAVQKTAGSNEPDLHKEGARLYPFDIDGYIEYKSPFIEKIYANIGL